MGGGSPPSQTTQTVTQAVPEYLQAGQQQGISYANNLANTQFQPYTGQAVAPFSPDQMQYFQGVQNQQGAWAPTTMASQNVYGNVAGGQYTPTINQTNANLPTINPNQISQNISNYYDPAVSKEIGGMRAAIQNQNDIQNATADRQAGSQGAYGGSGSALIEAQNNRNADLAMGQYTSQLLPQVYGQAIGASQQDIANKMNAQTTMGQQSLGANAQNLGYAQLAEQASLGGGQLALGGAQALEGSGYNAAGAGYNDINQLGAAGTAQQTEAQNQLNFPLSQYNTALSWPYQTLAMYNQSLGTAAANPGMTQTTQSPYSPLAAGIGTGLAAYNIGNSLAQSYGSASGGRVRMKNGGALSEPMHFADEGRVPVDDSGGLTGIGSFLQTLFGGGHQADITQPPASPSAMPTGADYMRMISQMNAQNQRQNASDRQMALAAGLMAKGKLSGIGGVGQGILQGMGAGADYTAKLGAGNDANMRATGNAANVAYKAANMDSSAAFLKQFQDALANNKTKATSTGGADVTPTAGATAPQQIYVAPGYQTGG